MASRQTHTDTLPLPALHISGSAICRPFKVKGHIQMPKVSQTTNNKLPGLTNKCVANVPALLVGCNEQKLLAKCVTKESVWSS